MKEPKGQERTNNIVRVSARFKSREEIAFRTGEWVGHFTEKHKGDEGYDIKGFGHETVFVKTPQEEGWIPVHLGFVDYKPNDEDIEREVETRRKQHEELHALDDELAPFEEEPLKKDLRESLWKQEGMTPHESIRLSGEELDKMREVYERKDLFTHWTDGYGDANFCVCMLERKDEHREFGSIAELREYQKRTAGMKRWREAEEEILRRVLMEEEKPDQDAERVLRGDSA